MKLHLLLLMVSVCAVLQQSMCHIRLTYPRARTYEFDFLDNVRTPGPCGMPGGLGTRTSLQAGQRLDIHWHLGYPHRGGFYFELLDSAEKKLQRFPPNTTQFAGTTDGTSLNYTIQLPGTTCANCTLRMVRQAAEWSGGPSTPYLFWSCADVNIVQSLSASDRCSGVGTFSEQTGCSCQRLYTGDKCQFKDECDDDADCGGHGMCVNTESTSYPKKQCYCKHGWFGTSCMKQSSVNTVPADMAAYQLQDISDEVKLYYRIVQDEVEVVMKAKTASWMGVGWRAPATEATCRDFPDLPNKYVPEGSAAAEGGSAEAEGTAEGEGGTAEGETNGNSTAEGKAEAESVAKGNSTAKGTAQAEGNSTAGTAKGTAHAEGNSTAEAEGTAEGEAHAEGNSTAEAEVTAEGEGAKAEGTAEGQTIKDACPVSGGGAAAEGASPEGASPEGASAKGASAKPEGASAKPEGASAKPEGSSAKPEGASAKPEGASAKPEGASAMKPEGASAKPEGATAKPEGASAKPEGASAKPEGATAEGAKPEGAAAEGASAEGSSGKKRLHPMDCTDLVIGSARGQYSRVGDYYTRDRSTPVHDEYLGGTNSLTAAMAWEEGEYTNMLFRRKLNSTDRADHSLKNEPTHVIWAKGQKHGDYRHCPGSSLETKYSSIKDFYKTDELKYHGHGDSQRGAVTLNFYTTTKPQNDDCTRGSCPAGECGYDLTWVLDPATGTVTFTLTSEFMLQDQWIALGFSNDRKMPFTDVVYGGMQGGTFIIQDGWIADQRVAPTVDASQDVTLVSGSHTNSVTTMTFRRKLVTGDNSDFQITDDNCPYLMYAKGGSMRSTGAITKHGNTPVVSAQRICFSKCLAKRQFRTPVALKITGVNFQPALQDTNSREFMNLKDTLTPSLENGMRASLGNKFVSALITGFRPGSIIVDFDVVTASSGGEGEVKTDVQAAARDVQVAQSLGQYKLDPLYLEVKDPQPVDQKSDKSDELTEMEIIIIAVVVALVVVAIIIGVCKFLEMKRARRNDKRGMMRESSSSSGGSGGRNSAIKNGTMSYGEFMATGDGKGDRMSYSDDKRPPPYPAYVNPGYDSAGYKNVP